MGAQPEDVSTGGPVPASRRAEAGKLALFDAAVITLVRCSTAPERRDEPVDTRALFSWRWVCFHLASIVLVVAMIWLGWWQLRVSQSRGYALQNFSYWVQWWAFSAFVVFFWFRAVRLARNPPADRSDGGVVVAAPGTELQRRSVGDLAPRSGPTCLVAPESSLADPVVYRGYVTPSSRNQPVRSHGDGYHDSYNDYLWQIGLADGETPTP